MKPEMVCVRPLLSLPWLRIGLVIGLFMLALSVSFVMPGRIVRAANTTYYVDCSAGSNGDGTQSSPWNTLDSVNSTTFASGDSILFQRGMTCSGMLQPQGSGSSAAPITIGAYGDGAEPIISGGSNTAAVQLLDQEYWDIENIETTGGNPYGIHISGSNSNTNTLHHIHLINVTAHDVGGNVTSASPKDVGVIAISAGSSQTLNDVLVDGATVYSTNEWFGIYIGGGIYPNTPGTNITVQNSLVHDVGGSGILISAAQNALTQNNVAYNIGAGPTIPFGDGTPNAIWDFNCTSCTVQNNEAYQAHTASGPYDGGAYDIDFASSGQTVQYNYGHDADGYCFSVFSSDAIVETNSVIRYNVCANNGRVASLNQGDVELSSFDDGSGRGSGSINGVAIYNNTFYWNPAGNEALLHVGSGIFSGSNPNFFKNNLIYSTVPSLIDDPHGSLSLDNNLYWYTGTGTPTWSYNGTSYNSFSSYQSGSRQDGSGQYADPLLNDPTYHGIGRPLASFTLQPNSPALGAGVDVGNMGAQDFFGNALPQTHNIGAYEGSGTTNSTGMLGADNFESGTANWTPGWGSWSTCQHGSDSTRAYCQTNRGGGASTAGGSSWANYSMTSAVNLPDSNAQLDVFGRYVDGSHFYYAMLGKDGKGHKMWGIWKNAGGTYSSLASGSYDWPGNTWFQLRLDMSVNRLTASIARNGGQSFRILGSAKDSSYKAGRIGLGAWAPTSAINATAYFDTVTAIAR